MTIHDDLCAIQQRLHVTKDNRTQRFAFRNIEDINEAVKPLLAELHCTLHYTDELLPLGEFVFVTSQAILTNAAGETESSVGHAVINPALLLRQDKAMSPEQACGSSSTYARRYAVQGLFALDNSEDDPDNLTRKTEQEPKPAPKQEPKPAQKPTEFTPEVLTDLWKSCVKYGVRPEGMKAWLHAYGLDTRKAEEYTEQERLDFGEYLWGRMNDARQIQQA